jgi:hypothetical protein
MTRINYTGRKRIYRENVQLRLSSEESLKLRADRIDLSDIELPGDARIILEAQVRTNLVRVECGTVAKPELPCGQPLPEFDSPEGITFRVKVVGVSGDNDGKLLAAADGLRATTDGEEDSRQSLLPVRPADIGQLLWRLDFDDTGFPSLLINKFVPNGWNEFARQPYFRALVFPEVIRQVASWVVENLADALDNPDSPAAPWMKYFKVELGQDLSAMAIPSDDEGGRQWALEWADEIAEKFSRKHRFLESVGKILGDEQ